MHLRVLVFSVHISGGLESVSFSESGALNTKTPSRLQSVNQTLSGGSVCVIHHLRLCQWAGAGTRPAVHSSTQTLWDTYYWDVSQSESVHAKKGVHAWTSSKVDFNYNEFNFNYKSFKLNSGRRPTDDLPTPSTRKWASKLCLIFGIWLDCCGNSVPHTDKLVEIHHLHPGKSRNFSLCMAALKPSLGLAPLWCWKQNPKVPDGQKNHTPRLKINLLSCYAGLLPAASGEQGSASWFLRSAERQSWL